MVGAKMISWKRLRMSKDVLQNISCMQEGLGGSVKTEGFREGEPFAGRLE